MQDEHWIYCSPEFPSAVQWSEDNLLAVAAGNFITVLNPGQLGGPRGFAAVDRPAPDSLCVGVLPFFDARPSCGRYNRAVAYETNVCRDPNATASFRCVAWTSLGCTSQGGCLLAGVTDDHRVRTALAVARAFGQIRPWKAGGVAGAATHTARRPVPRPPLHA